MFARGLHSSPCSLVLSRQVSTNRLLARPRVDMTVTANSSKAGSSSKQDEAAEYIVKAVEEKVSKEKLDLKGGPEAVAERLVKETDGGEIKKIELERKHAEIVPGEAGSGVERGSAASAAQSAVDRASDPNRTSMPEAAEKAKDRLAAEMQNQRGKTNL